MDQRRTLLVLRHAQTEDVRPGSKDSERRLTPDGERHAVEVGDYLTEPRHHGRYRAVLQRCPRPANTRFAQTG